MPHRRAVALVVTLLVGLLLLPASPAAAAGSLLQLDPSSGPAGASIRVTPIVKTAGSCTVAWDGQPVGSFPCGPDAASGVLGWTTLARVVRGEVLSLKERDYVVFWLSRWAGSFAVTYTSIARW